MLDFIKSNSFFQLIYCRSTNNKFKFYQFYLFFFLLSLIYINYKTVFFLPTILANFTEMKKCWKENETTETETSISMSTLNSGGNWWKKKMGSNCVFLFLSNVILRILFKLSNWKKKRPKLLNRFVVWFLNDKKE